jgi:predicted Zn-dependent protease
MNDWPEAIVDYTEAIRLRPAQVSLYIDRGDAYAKARQPEKAIDD